jgi:hypothetical protein
VLSRARLVEPAAVRVSCGAQGRWRRSGRCVTGSRGSVGIWGGRGLAKLARQLVMQIFKLTVLVGDTVLEVEVLCV